MDGVGADKTGVIGYFDKIINALLDRGVVVDGDMRVLAAGRDVQPLNRWGCRGSTDCACADVRG